LYLTILSCTPFGPNTESRIASLLAVDQPPTIFPHQQSDVPHPSKAVYTVEGLTITVVCAMHLPEEHIKTPVKIAIMNSILLILNFFKTVAIWIFPF
jgi:hypothetical protein